MAKVSAPEARPLQAALDAEATAYDRIEAPASGKSGISEASIAATQAAFDKVGDLTASR